VAHSNCQQKLEEIWYTGVRKISKMNPIIIILLTVLHVLTLPLTSLIYIIAPNSKVGKRMSQPCIKFITHTSSYLFFIGMVIGSYFITETSPGRFTTANPLYNLSDYPVNNATFVAYVQKNLNIKVSFCDFYIRINQPHPLDVIISVWVIGKNFYFLYNK
jgi:hypothetical protein